MRPIKEILKEFWSKPIWFWLGFSERFEYEIADGCVFRVTAKGRRQVLVLSEVRSWRRNKHDKSVSIFQYGDRARVIGDSSDKLGSILERELPERRMEEDDAREELPAGFMSSEMEQLLKLTARSRMAYSLACLEGLTARLNYTSPKYKELLDVLWSFTETKNYGAWNSIILSDKWGDYYNYGMWLGTGRTQGNLISKTDLFADAPQAVVGMMGLCALIGEAHLYGAFQTDGSKEYLEKVLAIMGDQGVPLPPMERFQENSLENAGKGNEMGFPAPRSFYMTSEWVRSAMPPEKNKEAIIAAIMCGDISYLQKAHETLDFIGNKELGAEVLTYVIQEEQFLMADWLLSQGLDLNNRGLWDETPLWHSVYRGELKAVTYLLEHGASVNAVSPDGDSMLHCSVDMEVEDAICKSDEQQKHVPASDEMTRLLVRFGADVRAVNAKGETALDWAIRRGHAAAEKFLRAMQK